MYRNIVVPTLRGQKRQILLAHMSVGLVLFADMSPTVPRPFPRTGLLDRSDSPDSPHLQVRDDINTSAFCRTCIGDGNLSEVRTGIWPDGRCLHRCAASKIANAALCGSAITAMRPISSIFMGGM